MAASFSYNCLLITLYQTNIIFSSMIFIISNSSSLLIIPFLYFYFKTLTSDNIEKNKNKIIHFFPAIISFIILSILCTIYPLKELEWCYHLPASYIEANNEISSLNIIVLLIQDVPFAFQLIVYGFLFAKLISKHRKNILDRFANIEKINLSWFKTFLIFYSIFCILFLFLFFILKIDNIIAEIYFSLLSLFYVLFFGYFGIKQFEIYTENVNSKIITQKEIQENRHQKPNGKQNPYTFLENQEKQAELSKQIKTLFYNQKPHLDENLSLSGLAKMLNINKSYLSAFFNKVLKTSFYSYINEKRIEACIKMFENPEFKKYSIEGIAKLAGFSSKSTFNNNFKSKTGQIPSIYRKRIYDKEKRGDKMPPPDGP
ncbi:MAG: helix-turn-helix transcriptional regulator [Bacteroidales bacterium]|nr:helix-turn-helix transcriptional regulator [Bacteroidales bacterium]